MSGGSCFVSDKNLKENARTGFSIILKLTTMLYCHMFNGMQNY